MYIYFSLQLAKHLTRLVHGEDGLGLALKTTDILYGGVREEDIGPKLASLSQSEMTAIFDQASYVRLMFTPGLSMLDFATKIGCFKQGEKEAQRIISAGGFSLNQVRRTNIDELIIPDIHILPNKLSLVRVGKRNYHIIEWTV